MENSFLCVTSLMDFPEINIKDFATPEIIERGTLYFMEERVRNLRQIGDRFTADIRGSKSYLAEIIVEADGIRAYCNCPYSGEKWCKHLTAMAFEILAKRAVTIEPSQGNKESWAAEIKAFSPLAQKHLLQQQKLKKIVDIPAEMGMYLHPLPGPLLDIEYLLEAWSRILVLDPSRTGKDIIEPILQYRSAHHYDTLGQAWWILYEMQHEQLLNRDDTHWLKAFAQISQQLELSCQYRLIAPAMGKRFLQALFTRTEYLLAAGLNRFRWSEIAWVIATFISDGITAQYVQMKIDALGLMDELGFGQIMDKIKEVQSIKL